MRKFIATIAVFIVLIGMFVPVDFSRGITMNANAGGDLVETTFGTKIEILNTATAGKFELKTAIKYDSGLASTGDELIVDDIFIDLRHTVVEKTTREAVVSRNVSDTLNGTFRVFDSIEKEVVVPVQLADGTYQAWFWENYNLSTNDLISSKIEFTVLNGKLSGTPQQIYTTTNTRGNKETIFGPLVITETTAGTPERVSVKFTVTYKDDKKTASDTVNEDLRAVLTGSDITTPINIPLELTTVKYNTPFTGSFKINRDLSLQKTYQVYLYDETVETSSGDRVKSQTEKFTIGNLEQSVTLDQTVGTQVENDAEENKVTGVSGYGCAGWLDIPCHLTVFLVDLITFVPNFLAILVGVLADIFLHISIKPETYGVAGSGIESGIRDAWKIVRDFANIGFIFALFVASFMFILNKTSVGGKNFEPKKVVVKVIVMALLVNFSLVFCRAIIQTADVFSHVLYEKIDPKGTVARGAAQSLNNSLEKQGIRSVSLRVISLANPQNLFGNKKITSGMSGSNVAYLVVGFSIFFVLLILIWTFASMLFIFLGRILGLWLGMIVSPIAFVSYAIPFLEDNPYIGFDNWLKSFAKLAFLTPIYMFFMYITVTVLNIQDFSGITSLGASGGGNESWLVSVFNLVLTTMIPLLIACFMLLQGKKIATDMAGVVGEMVGKMSGAVTGVALGAATGGTAFMARQSLGRAGAAVANSTTLMKTQAGGGISGWGAGMLRNAGKSTSAASFDVRKSDKIMKGFQSATGAMGDKVDLGTNYMREGGFKAEGTPTEQWNKYAESVAKNAEERKKAKADALEADMKEVHDKEERKIKQATEENDARLKNEENKIQAEAGNQKIDTVISEKQGKITTNNTEIADITRKYMGKAALTDAEKTAIIAEKKRIEDDLAAGGALTPDKKARRDELAAKEAAFKERDRAEARKGELVAENNKLKAEVKTFAGLGGKSINDAKHEVEMKKLNAKDSPEGKELAKVEGEIKKEDEELRKLKAKEKEAKEAGREAELLDIKEKIKRKNAAIRDLQTNKLKTAKDKFENAHGIKALEDGIKAAEKEYIKSQEARLLPMQNIASDLKKQLVQQQYNATKAKRDLMTNLAQTYDNDAGRTGYVGGTVRGLSNVLGVISGGSVGGSNLNRNTANINSANHARERARGR